MKIIYRYIRPLQFNHARVTLDTTARGGICLRYEEREDKQGYFFSHSRCREDELFSKDTARTIADQRAMSTDPTVRNLISIAYDNDIASLCAETINFCHTWEPAPYPPLVGYHVQELRQLGRALQSILECNVLEARKLRDWIVIQGAGNIRGQYANR